MGPVWPAAPSNHGHSSLDMRGKNSSASSSASDRSSPLHLPTSQLPPRNDPALRALVPCSEKSAAKPSLAQFVAAATADIDKLPHRAAARPRFGPGQP